MSIKVEKWHYEQGNEDKALLTINLGDGVKLGDLDPEDTYLIETVSEPEALELICDLIKVFHIPNSNIEVIHFPAGANKAECLRNSADKLDAEGETEVSCPLEPTNLWGDPPTRPTDIIADTIADRAKKKGISIQQAFGELCSQNIEPEES